MHYRRIGWSSAIIQPPILSKVIPEKVFGNLSVGPRSSRGVRRQGDRSRRPRRVVDADRRSSADVAGRSKPGEVFKHFLSYACRDIGNSTCFLLAEHFYTAMTRPLISVSEVRPQESGEVRSGHVERFLFQVSADARHSPSARSSRSIRRTALSPTRQTSFPRPHTPRLNANPRVLSPSTRRGLGAQPDTTCGSERAQRRVQKNDRVLSHAAGLIFSSVAGKALGLHDSLMN